MTTAALLLGVDGGGTATTAWLAHAGAATPIGRGRAGAANAITEGVDGAARAVGSAVAAAFADAGRRRCAVDAACLALAGAGRPSVRAAVASHPDVRALATEVVVTHDAEAVLAGAVGPGGAGVAIVAGTGAVAWGRGADGSTARAGGWGHLIDDAGSAFGIGAAALRAALRAADGRAADDGLLGLLSRHLGVRDAAELPARLGTAREIAGLAPFVVAAADAGNRSARHIVTEAIEDLVEMAASVVANLALPRDDLVIALGGGVLIGNAALAERLVTSLATRGIQPARVVPVRQPAAGAVAIARAGLETGAPDGGSGYADGPDRRIPMSQAEHDKRIDYIELAVNDVADAKRFYGTLFGWSFKDYGDDYASFHDGRIGGGFRSDVAPTPGGPLVVMYVKDLEAMRDAVRDAGGTITVDIFDFPGGRRFHFGDPSGNLLAVWSE